MLPKFLLQSDKKRMQTKRKASLSLKKAAETQGLRPEPPQILQISYVPIMPSWGSKLPTRLREE